ncbi:ABC transporter ATP-binding protein [Oenococcus sp. UCMA 16435]|nr:ABC transporter ATP-binding protein [Oenococcus sp. UCMA 16435]MDI4583871.1 ATP-binding cassette domain-containing protein [Oenococcus sp. UCMA 14587]
MESFVDLQHVKKSYASRAIIKDLSFQVFEKEFISIIGPSGCGKSTLLNMIGLLETVDGGSIILQQKKLPKINSRKATLIRRNTINYLFQSFALINDISVKSNLMLSMRFSTLSTKEKVERIEDVLTKIDLAELAETTVNSLSGGEQQRVALARAILKPGQLILADEPTGALDNRHANDAFNLIKKLRDDYNKTVIMVTHNLDLAKKSDRVIELG